MTAPPRACARPAERIRERATFRWLAAGALLLAEYLLTSHAVDVEPLATRGDWLAVFGSAGNAGPIVLAIATATLLIGGPRLFSDLHRALEAAAARQEAGHAFVRWVSVAIHLAGFATFLSLTIFFSRAAGALPSGAVLLAAAWLGSGVIAVLALAHAVIPLSALLPTRLARSLALGAALGISAWGAGVATVRFWDPLGAPTLHAVAATLRLVSADVSMDPASATLGVEGFAVVIAPVCSGYEGIGLLSILVLAYLVMFRSELRFPHVLALLPLGIALSWLANVLRLSGLMLVGARWSPDLALGSFHSKAGWVLFCGIALGLVASTRRAAIFRRHPPVRDLRDSWNPTAAYLTPLLALVAAHLATGLFTTDFPLLYPVGVAAGAAALWWHRGTCPWLLRPSWSWGACAIGVAAFLLWIALEPAADSAAVDDWRLALASLPLPVAGLWLVFRVLGSVLIVPLVEELAFRGYLLRRLFSADFTSVPFSRFGWVSFLVSSIAFGLLHERWLAGILAGMLFALAQYRRGRLSDAVLAHAVTNLLVAFHAIGWNQWSLWM